MSKYTIALLFVFSGWFASVAHAQKVEFGVTASGGMAGGAFEVPNSSIDYQTKFIPAVVVGGAVRWRVNDKFSIIPGLQFSSKGVRTQFTTRNIEVKVANENTNRISCINLPIGFFYQQKHLFVGAGIYTGVALAGKVSRKKTLQDVTSGLTETNKFSQQMSFDETDSSAYVRASRFDYGLKGELGYEFKGYRVSVGYEHGLSNAIPRFDGLGSSFHHHVLMVSWAYFFRNARF